MKKTFIALFFLAFGLLPREGFGQISRGTILLGGGLNYNNSNLHQSISTANYKNSSFSLMPMAGFFIANNLVVGAGFGLNTQKQKAGYDIVFKSSGYSYGPFVRYYKFLGEKTAVFGNAAFDYATSNGKSRQNSDNFVPTNKIKNVGAFLTPGITYFATPKIGLEITIGSVGYFKNTTTDNLNTPTPEKTSNSGFGVNFGAGNAVVGVRFYLARR